MSDILNSIKEQIDKVANEEFVYIDKNYDNYMKIFMFVIETQHEINILVEESKNHIEKLMFKNINVKKYKHVEVMYRQKIMKKITRANHVLRNKCNIYHDFYIFPTNKYHPEVLFRPYNSVEFIWNKMEQYITITGNNYFVRIEHSDLSDIMRKYMKDEIAMEILVSK